MQFIFIPILTGLFGWILIWLLAKSLFFPTKPIQIGGFTWASSLHPLIKQFPFEILMPSDNESEASFKAIQPLMEDKLDYFFTHTIKDKLPMMSMFIGDKTVAQLKLVFLAELASIFPQMMGQFTLYAKANVTESLVAKLSITLTPIIMKAFRPIQWLAFFLGLGWGWLIVYGLSQF